MLSSSSRNNMRKKTRLPTQSGLACLLLCAALQSPQTSLASDSLESQSARVEVDRVLQEYFSAVRSGSALKLSRIFGDPLRSQFPDHLHGPSYRDDVVKTYKRAKFAVLDSPVVDGDYVKATVEITLENSERIRERITLARDPASHRLLLVDIEGVPLDATARSAE